MVQDRMARADKRLRPREVQTLIGIGRGYSIQQTADWMGISKNTVRTQTQHIRVRLGVHTTTRALVIALATGQIDFKDLFFPGDGIPVQARLFE